MFGALKGTNEQPDAVQKLDAISIPCLNFFALQHSGRRHLRLRLDTTKPAENELASCRLGTARITIHRTRHRYASVVERSERNRRDPDAKLSRSQPDAHQARPLIWQKITTIETL